MEEDEKEAGVSTTAATIAPAESMVNAQDGDESDISDMSDISGLSEDAWRPIAGPISWVQRQIVSGRDPRDVLHGLIPHDATIPEDVNDFTLWKIIVSLVSEPPRRKKLKQYNTLEDAITLMRESKNIIVLTGAGVSVSCGIPDFRSKDGIYARLAVDFPDLPDPHAMFDIHYFNKDPRPFFKFAKEIYPGQYEPSKSHHFIKLIESHRRLLRNYTQNIDTLEEVAGIQNVIHCHGSFADATCMNCFRKVSCEAIRADIFNQVIPLCTSCSPDTPCNVMKPNIVFFGESLPEEFHSQMGADKDVCDLLIVIGSSLKVRPVSLIPNSIPNSVPQILINRESLRHMTFDIELLGDCDVIVNELCKHLGSDWSPLSDTSDHMTQVSREELDRRLTAAKAETRKLVRNSDEKICLFSENSDNMKSGEKSTSSSADGPILDSKQENGLCRKNSSDSVNLTDSCDKMTLDHSAMKKPRIEATFLSAGEPYDRNRKILSNNEIKDRNSNATETEIEKNREKFADDVCNASSTQFMCTVQSESKILVSGDGQGRDTTSCLPLNTAVSIHTEAALTLDTIADNDMNSQRCTSIYKNDSDSHTDCHNNTAVSGITDAAEQKIVPIADIADTNSSHKADIDTNSSHKADIDDANISHKADIDDANISHKADIADKEISLHKANTFIQIHKADAAEHNSLVKAEHADKNNSHYAETSEHNTDLKAEMRSQSTKTDCSSQKSFKAIAIQQNSSLKADIWTESTSRANSSLMVEYPNDSVSGMDDSRSCDINLSRDNIEDNFDLITDYIKDTEYIFLPPCRYVFPGAEFCLDDDRPTTPESDTDQPPSPSTPISPKPIVQDHESITEIYDDQVD